MKYSWKMTPSHCLYAHVGEPWEEGGYDSLGCLLAALDLHLIEDEPFGDENGHFDAATEQALVKELQDIGYEIRCQ
jgi:hypothetical protein